jgi:hypothetical protein
MRIKSNTILKINYKKISLIKSHEMHFNSFILMRFKNLSFASIMKEKFRIQF